MIKLTCFCQLETQPILAAELLEKSYTTLKRLYYPNRSSSATPLAQHLMLTNVPHLNPLLFRKGFLKSRRFAAIGERIALRLFEPNLRISFGKQRIAWNLLQHKEDAPTIPPLLTLAKSFLDDLMVTQKITTIYSHENAIKDCEWGFNCYGFILHLINTYNRKAFEELLFHMDYLHHQGIEKSLDEARPSPYNFFHIFKGLSEEKLQSLFWEGIEDIFALIPGDLLVYMKPGFVSPKHWRKNIQPVTHIMLVSEIISKTAETLEIEIIDSAHQPHNTENDTRHKLRIKGGLGKARLLITKTETPGIYSLAWGEGGQNCVRKELFGGRFLPQ